MLTLKILDFILMSQINSQIGGQITWFQSSISTLDLENDF